MMERIAEASPRFKARMAGVFYMAHLAMAQASHPLLCSLRRLLRPVRHRARKHSPPPSLRSLCHNVVAGSGRESVTESRGFGSSRQRLRRQPWDLKQTQDQDGLGPGKRGYRRSDAYYERDKKPDNIISPFTIMQTAHRRTNHR